MDRTCCTRGGNADEGGGGGLGGETRRRPEFSYPEEGGAQDAQALGGQIGKA